jgi:hypothetical protein
MRSLSVGQHRHRYEEIDLTPVRLSSLEALVNPLCNGYSQIVKWKSQF